MHLPIILFQFFLQQYLIAYDFNFLMRCSNFKLSSSDSEYVSWTCGLWELKIVQSELPNGKQAIMELFAWETSSCLCCQVDKLCLFFKMWKRIGGILYRKSRFGKAWIPWKILSGLSFQPSTFISPTDSYASISKVSRGQQLYSPLTEKIFTYLLHSGKIATSFRRWVAL